MKRIVLSLFIATLNLCAFAQPPSPDEFLGYTLGTRFTPHQKVIEYFRKVASTSKNIQLKVYGKTYEGRELLLAVVSDASNMERLEQIRENSLLLSQAGKGAKIAKQPAILWLSYNVHGNEASSTETAMKVIYTLASAKTEEIRNWLKNTVVIIDPCLNPDGRDRYVNYFNMVSRKHPDPDPDPGAREHSEPWPGGRPNHYYFDLNRDWAWQTQIETEQRLAAYHQWMPQVHVDFHEQSYNEPYYFAPAAEPVHQDITVWQREFQVIVGRNNAKYFDENGWQYFTKERFDLLYPSYGDTYPLYNGAIGMTYEQGGIRAGLAVVTADGDTLTLRDRIEHHFTTSMATLGTVSLHAERLVGEFKKYFEQSAINPPGAYKTYVVKGQNIGRLRKMAELLKRNHVDFAFGADRTLSGYNYETQKVESFKVDRNDLIVNLQQPRSVMANVLFEPQTFVTDSNTYDITAWALPYAFGLNAYAVKEPVAGSFSFIEEKPETFPTVAKPYAWVMNWSAVKDAQTLIELQRRKVKVRIAEDGFVIGGKSYPAGSLLIYRAENEKNDKDFIDNMAKVAKDFNAQFFPLTSGYVEKGKDFGSSVYRLLTVPKIAVASGQEVTATAMGEIWHFLEQELNYPISIVNTQNLSYLDINKYNVLVLPDGYYSDKLAEQLLPWINAGGKLIAMEDAIGSLLGKRPFDLKKKEYPKADEKDVNARRYAEKDKDDLQNAIPGAIYKVSIDQSHPLMLGLGKFYYTLKTDEKIYEPLASGWNVGSLKANSYVAGIAGEKVRKKLASGLLYGVQQAGKGTIVYLGTNVLFRSFWENGKQLFANALFLVN